MCQLRRHHWPHYFHWNKNVVILTKFSSLAALEVVILTTSSAASDEHFIKMKTFPFQCSSHNHYQPTIETFRQTWHELWLDERQINSLSISVEFDHEVAFNFQGQILNWL